MFLPERKIEIIHGLFKTSHKPTLANILYQDKEMSKISKKIKNSLTLSKYNSKYNRNTVKTEESYFPYYTYEINCYDYIDNCILKNKMDTTIKKTKLFGGLNFSEIW